MNRLALRRVKASISTIAAFSIAFVSLSALPANAQGLLAEGSLAVVPDAAPMSVVSNRLPAVDSQAGWGDPLGTDPLVRVDLHGTTGTHASALVRVTVPAAASDTVIFTGDAANPTPILRAAASRTASTTALLAVANGTIALWANTPSEVRIEAIAAFDGERTIPGSTIVLPVPVMRADTSAGLGGAALLPSDPLAIGITGEGGVAADLVRAVYASVSLFLSEASTVDINGLSLSLPAGDSTITSVFTPDDQGMISLALARGKGSLRLDVLGWIPEADTDFEQANVVGSFVNSTERTVEQSVRVDASGKRAALQLDIADTADSSHSLVLLSATPSKQLSLLSFEPTAGRAHGVAIDPVAGALPQLALAPTPTGASTLTVNRGSAQATVISLGDFLHDAPRPSADAPSIAITAPLTQSAIDLGENGVFTLQGTLETPGAALERVEISSPDAGLIGTAEFDTDADGAITWSFEAAAPDDGTFEYVATVFDRSGGHSSDSVHIDITAADDSDVVISMNTVQVNGAGQPVMALVAPHTVSFDARPDVEPFDVLVSDVADTLPDGFFERVVSINRVGASWIVTTASADLDEVFYQAALDEEVVVDNPAGIVRTEDESAPTGDPVSYSEIDNGDEGAYIVTGDDVDLDPYADTPDAPGTLAAAASGAPNASVSMAFGFAPSFLVKWGSAKPDVTNLTDAGEAERENAKKKVDDSAFEQETSVVAYVDAETQVSVTLTMILDVKMKWKWKFQPAGVDVHEFSVLATTKLKATMSLKASLEWEGNLNLTKDIVGFSLPTIRFMAGVVPIVITNKLTLGFMLDLKLSASLSIPTFGYSREETNGFRYTTARGIERVHEGPGSTFLKPGFEGLPGTVSAHLDGTVAAGPRIKFESRMYGVVGPTVSAGAQLAFDASLLIPDVTKPTLAGRIELYARALIEARAELKILKWTLLDLKLASKEFRYTFWRAQFGPMPTALLSTP